MKSSSGISLRRAFDHDDRRFRCRHRRGRGRSVRICGWVGLATNLPLTRPTRTAPIGPAKGMSETMSAAEAPLMVRISGSFSPSALRSDGDDLRVVEVALGEERAQRAVRHAAGEDFLFARDGLRA